MHRAASRAFRAALLPTLQRRCFRRTPACFGKVQDFLTSKRIHGSFDCGEVTVINDSDTFAWVVMDSQKGSANSLSEAYIESTKAALNKVDELIAEKKARVVILTSNKDTFCVGADLPTVYPLLPNDADKARLNKIFDDGKELTDRLKGMKVPLVAAINGMALGGGLEITLVCHHRVMSSSDSCKVGLPETLLGVIPGLGGTVRLQKLIGLQQATPMILQGQQIKADKARRLGLVQEVIPGDDRIPGEFRFLNGARSFAGKLVDRKVSPHKGKPEKTLVDKFINKNSLGHHVLKSQAMKTLNKLTKGKYLGQYRALESLLFAAKNSEEKALQREREIFTECLFTPEAKNQMAIYFLDEQSKKLDKKIGIPKDAVAKPETAAVVGAGVMGSGIAHWFAVRGLKHVYMRDIKQEFVDKGMAFVHGEFDAQLKKKKLTPAKHAQLKAAVVGGTEEDGLRNCEVIVEAAVEVMDLKKKMIQDLEASGVLDGKRIFATNTSSLSLNEMQAVSKHPELIVGMHFFNPVAKMPLVEIITGDKTSKEATAAIYKLTLAIGKKPIVVKDGPGFLVNRVLGVYMAEAGRMIAEKADPQKVDKLVLGFGMPMGPFRLLDEVGFDVAAHVGPVLENGLKSARFAASDDEGGAVGKLLKAGYFGKKNQKGFYKYDAKGKETGFDASTLSALGLTPDSKFKYEHVVDRCMLLMINEACFIMEEGLVDGPETVDLGMIFGTGFAPFRGGLCSWADSEGAKRLVDRMANFQELYGERFVPAQTLKDLAAKGGRFFPNRPFLPYQERKGFPSI
eukprot:TRINITY_DN35_c0_g1_i3.p1 TRINITY_DN35_c0_g1~~TRINITY_DN35_c0_g1_i3.p1  ORF type:complete len:829 (+),score=350.37 TRINITY_DN35_c0_g1_i3:101-2488(+)